MGYFGFAEHHIQLALRLFVREGDTVYDVGANKGWLTKPISDLVGNTGKVVAFEASRRNLEELAKVVASEALTNASVVSAAVYHTSNTTVDFFEHPFSNADSLFPANAEAVRVPVNTIALDDYYRFNTKAPSFIKADIEGAEYEMLLGARNLLETCRPILVLEMRPDDGRCWALLHALGYVAFDLLTFREVSSQDDIESDLEVTDYIFLPDPRQGDVFRARPSRQERVPCDLRGDFIEFDIELDAGLSRLEFAGSAAQFADAVLFQVVDENRSVAVSIFPAFGAFKEAVRCIVHCSTKRSVRAYVVQRGGDLHLWHVDVQTVPLPQAMQNQLYVLSLMNPLGSTLPPPKREDAFASPAQVPAHDGASSPALDLVRAGPYLIIADSDDPWVRSLPAGQRGLRHEQLASLEAVEDGAAHLDHLLATPFLGLLAKFAAAYRDITVCDVGVGYGIDTMDMVRVARTAASDVKSFAFECGSAGRLAPQNFANNGFDIRFEPAVVAPFDGFRLPQGNEIGASTAMPIRCLNLDRYLAEHDAVRPACIRFPAAGGQHIPPSLRELIRSQPSILHFVFAPWLLRDSGIDPATFLAEILETHTATSEGVAITVPAVAAFVGRTDGTPPHFTSITAVSKLCVISM